MKNLPLIFVAIVFLSISYTANAQYCSGYKNKGIKELPGTKTLVTLSGDDAYDNVLKDAIKTHWTHTEIEYISMKEIDAKIAEAQYSFIVPVTFTLVEEQHQLALIMGGKPSLDKYNILHLVSFALLDGLSLEKDYKDCAHRLHHMIKTMNDAINIAIEQQFSSGINDKLEGYYNAKSPQIKNKTLLINKGYMSTTLKEEDIKKLYKHPYEIVETAKIAEAIKNKDEKYCYLLKANTRISYVFVFDAATGEVWYADSNNKLLKKEKISLLNETVSK